MAIVVLKAKHLQEIHDSLKNEIKTFCCKANRVNMLVEILIEEDINYLPAIRKMTARTPKEVRAMKEKEQRTFVLPSYYLDLI